VEKKNILFGKKVLEFVDILDCAIIMEGSILSIKNHDAYKLKLQEKCGHDSIALHLLPSHSQFVTSLALELSFKIFSRRQKSPIISITHVKVEGIELV